MPLLSLIPGIAYRWLALGLLLAAAMGWAWLKGAQHGEARLNAYILTQTQQADAELQKRLQKESALKVNQERLFNDLAKQKQARAAADSRATDSLQRLNTAIGGSPRANPDSPGRVAGAGIEGELLGQCATAYRDMASEAERLKEKTVGLQTYVQDICTVK